MRPKVFIGSSTEAFHQAKEVEGLLSSLHSVQCVMWNTVFHAGFLNFDALEEMLGHCSAAVFVATPDIPGTCRGRDIITPNPNVLLEFGLVAGRLGLRNVALCRYGNAELPSDLTGLTIIDMDVAITPGSVTSMELHDPRKKLKDWASRLDATIEAVPRTSVFHGYSGGWRYQLSLDRWWGLPIHDGSFVRGDGILNLQVCVSGDVGSGLAHGHIYFKITKNGEPAESVFQGEYRTAHEVVNVVCDLDGTMRLTTKMFALQKVISEGILPPEISAMTAFPEPWSSGWTLHPGDVPGQLKGKFHAEGAGDSQGKALLTKILD